MCRLYSTQADLPLLPEARLVHACLRHDATWFLWSNPGQHLRMTPTLPRRPEELADHVHVAAKIISESANPCLHSMEIGDSEIHIYIHPWSHWCVNTRFYLPTTWNRNPAFYSKTEFEMLSPSTHVSKQNISCIQIYL